MKKTAFHILIIALATLSMPFCCSCTKPSSQEEKHETKPEEPEPKGPQPGTYTFTASPLKGKWEVGDKIYVHGSYAPAAQMITLTATDISDDGRTASARLDSVTEYPYKPDGLYAAWPGDAVVQEDGLTDSNTSFSRMDCPLAVAYLSDTNFSFVDASSALSFSVSGYTHFALAGNQRPGLCFTEYMVDYSTNNESFTNRKNDGYPFLEGTFTDGSVLLWFPGAISMKGGLTIYLGDGDNWTESYTLTNDLKLPIGKITDLGDITASLVAYSGPAPRMPRMGKKTKYTVKFNELSGLCLSENGDFLWTVGDDGELAKLSFTGEISGRIDIDCDAEAVSRNPVTGDLLIGMEPNGVGRIAAPGFNHLETLFKIADAKGYGNAGVEGLTYYKDGLVYAGAQTGSDLFCCNLETGELVWKKRLRDIFPSITEIADLCYDPLTDWLWIIDSESRKFFALTGDAETLLGSYSVRGIENPESVCVDHKHSCIWVGDDYGSTSYLYRFDFTGLDDAILSNETN
jgi:hypothetical protein